MLVDRPGDPAKKCERCRNNSLAGAFGTVCMDTSSPDCNPVTCKATNDACLNDLP